MKYLKLVVGIILLASSCTNNNTPNAKLQTSPKRLNASPRGKPTKKDVLLLVMQSNAILLSVDPSCSGVGVEATDSTIGQYLSGFWQYQTDSMNMNPIDIVIEEGRDSLITDKHWNARFMINGRTENEPWSWGISFSILDANWEIITKSIRCLGGG